MIYNYTIVHSLMCFQVSGTELNNINIEFNEMVYPDMTCPAGVGISGMCGKHVKNVKM